MLAVVVDLIASADTGRSDNDHITNGIEQGDVRFALPGQVGNLIHGLWVPGSVRAYINGQPLSQPLAVASLTERHWNDLDLGGWDAFAEEGDFEISVTASYEVIEVSVPPAIGATWFEGFIHVTLDKTAPWGSAQLHPDSDTGPWSELVYRDDQVTADRTPGFFGTAEANCLVRVVIDGTPAGSAVAASEDGNAASQGTWQIDTTRSLADGQHTAVFTYEDVAGNQSTSTVSFTVDAQGPRVTEVEIGSAATYELFDPNPDDGPTPLVNSLAFTITDGTLYTTEAFNKANYQVAGPAHIKSFSSRGLRGAGRPSRLTFAGSGCWADTFHLGA